jgi:HD superfamily phosphohydrolase
VKIIRDSIHGDIELTKEEMRILHTASFQRLHGCRQLGLAHLVYPAAKHSRFEHVLGVMHLATNIADRLEEEKEFTFGEELRKVLRLSALLHDMGHVPFGHTLEDEMPVIKKHDASSTGSTKSRMDDAVTTVLMESQNSTFILLVLQTLRAINESKDDVKLYKLVDNGEIRSDLLVLADIIGNTICADLLDYIKRDHMMTGISATYDERIFRYFGVGEHELNGKHYRRLLIRLVRNGRVRGDCLADLLDILKLRYNLSDKVLFHPKKCAAGAMLIKAVSRLELPESSLMQLSDDGLLDEHRKDPLIEMLRSRKLFKPVFVCRLEHVHSYDEKQNKKQIIARLRKDHVLRQQLEERIQVELGLPKDKPLVLIYCPSPNMSLKLIRVLVQWKDGTIRRLNEIENAEDPSTVEQVSILQKIYPDLWKLYLFVHPSLRSRGEKIAQKFRDLLKEVLRMDVTCDPAFGHYLETGCEDYKVGRILDSELIATNEYRALSDSQQARAWSLCHDKLPPHSYDEDFAEANVQEIASRLDTPAFRETLQQMIKAVLRDTLKSNESEQGKLPLS